MPGTRVSLELDLVQVKGRATPTRIFTLADVLGCNAAVVALLCPRHEQFLRAYREQRWDESEALMRQCRDVGVQCLDTYYSVLATRIKNRRDASSDLYWNGVHVMTEK